MLDAVQKKSITIFLDNYEKNYRSIDREMYEWAISSYLLFCNEEHITPSLETAGLFFNERYNVDIFASRLKVYIRPMRRAVLLYLENLTNDVPRCIRGTQFVEKYPVPEEMHAAISEFFEGYYGKRELNDISRSDYHMELMRFCHEINKKHKIASLKQLTSDMLLDYLTQYGNTYRDSRRQKTSALLRRFTDYLYDIFLCPVYGSLVIPPYKKNKRESLPSVFSAEEVAAIINAIDIKTYNGKMANFAICLSAYCGLRSSEIIKLKIEDIDISNHRLRVYRPKIHTFNTIPMTKEVELAIADYLTVRPNTSEYSNILISNTKPYRPYKTIARLYEIFNMYLKKSGVEINGRRHGLHALRHSMATGALKSGASIEEISSILGHSTHQSTTVYLGTDDSKLRLLCLEVPND